MAVANGESRFSGGKRPKLLAKAGQKAREFVLAIGCVGALADAMVGKHEMLVGYEPALGETGLHASEMATVERQYRPACAGQPQERRNAAAHAGDAGHLPQAFARELQSERVGELGGA